MKEPRGFQRRGIRGTAPRRLQKANIQKTPKGVPKTGGETGILRTSCLPKIKPFKNQKKKGEMRHENPSLEEKETKKGGVGSPPH